MKFNEKRRKVTIPYTGFIPLIRMSGPIVQPITLPDQICKKLVSTGFRVFENGKLLQVSDFLTAPNPSAPVVNNKTKSPKTPGPAAPIKEAEVKPKEVKPEPKVEEVAPVEVTNEVVNTPVSEVVTAPVVEEVPQKLSKKERRRLAKEAAEKEAQKLHETAEKYVDTLKDGNEEVTELPEGDPTVADVITE